MKKYYKQIWLTFVGLICIGMTMRCFTLETLYSSLYNNYREFSIGEIQHATAITTSNVSVLQELSRLGTLTFLVASFIFFLDQLSDKKSDKDDENPFDDNVELV